jgi:hypothetical protein
MIPFFIRPSWKITVVENGSSFARGGKKHGNGQAEGGSQVSH